MIAGKTSVRLILLVIGASVMTLTTTPNKLTDALESLMRPLKALHVPVHEISMTMSIALRFIPIFTEETDRIKKAQMARGADFETGGLIRRVKAMVPLLVPLFVSAFRRANDLALAMEARCYHGGEGRTQMKPLRYRCKTPDPLLTGGTPASCGLAASARALIRPIPGLRAPDSIPFGLWIMPLFPALGSGKGRLHGSVSPCGSSDSDSERGTGFPRL